MDFLKIFKQQGNFETVADEFLNFIEDKKIIIHNAQL